LLTVVSLRPATPPKEYERTSVVTVAQQLNSTADRRTAAPSATLGAARQSGCRSGRIVGSDAARGISVRSGGRHHPPGLEQFRVSTSATAALGSQTMATTTVAARASYGSELFELVRSSAVIEVCSDERGQEPQLYSNELRAAFRSLR